MEAASNSNIRRREDLGVLVLVLGLAALFFLAFFNRFAGIRSGDGEFSGGIAFLAGRLPYRDYYTAGPPLNQLKSALELAVFGKALIVSRICAVGERLVIAAILYAWLRRSFSILASASATLVTIVVSAGDRTDPLASYNHDAILFAMLTGFLASLCLTAPTTRRLTLYAAASGAAAALSALTKQTAGIAVAIAVFVLLTVALRRLAGVRKTCIAMFAYVAGFAAPIMTVGAYLRHLGVLQACLQMLFVSGPAAKASGPGEFLTRELLVLRGNPVWSGLALLALVMSGAAMLRALQRVSPGGASSPRTILGFAVAGFLVIGTACGLALTSLPALQDFSKTSVYFSLAGSALLGLAAIFYGLYRENPRRSWEIALLSAVGWAVAVSLSLSWPAFEAMTLPALGVLLAAVHDGALPWGRRFLYLVMAAMVFLQVREKLDLPFAFNHQEEPAVRFATHVSMQPRLRGMRLPVETIRLLDETASAAQSQPQGSPIFTYPEMGLVYALTDRNPPTFSGSHNIDVVSDSFAEAEAARLLVHPPSVLLYARPTETDMHEDEKIWRRGRPSGQRSLVAALDSMTAQYILVDTFVLSPGDTPIKLYVLPAGRTP